MPVPFDKVKYTTFTCVAEREIWKDFRRIFKTQSVERQNAITEAMKLYNRAHAHEVFSEELANEIVQRTR